VAPVDRAARTEWEVAGREGRAFERILALSTPQGHRAYQVRVVPIAQGGPSADWLGTAQLVERPANPSVNRRDAARLRLIADLSITLAASLDVERSLRRLPLMLVPELADWCAISLKGSEEEDARQVATASREGSQHLGLHAKIEVPLRSQNAVLGVLELGLTDAKRRFEETDYRFAEEIATRISVALSNARLYERERLIATTFQQAALPMALPLVSGVVFDATYEPARDDTQVGGDWYDALRLADGRIVLSVGDVAGSGLHAAVLMASIRQILRGVAQIYPNPLAMIDAADRTLKVEHPDHIVTAFVAVFDPIDRKLSYATAGHPPPFLVLPDHRIVELSGSDLPLGLRTQPSEPVRTIDVPNGSLLVLYTDGLVEATHDILSGFERVEAELGRLSGSTRKASRTRSTTGS
jgi:hypothetical protein